MLSNGMDPVHLLLAVGSLDEVVSVCLRDDFKQVSLNVAFHPCGKAGRLKSCCLLTSSPSSVTSFDRCRTGVV